MPIDILMPQLSPTMTEGRLAKWTKAEGDNVSAGDVIAEVETDKATMEVEATDDGILHKIIGEAGTDIVVGKAIAILAAKGEKVAANYKPTDKIKVVAPEEEETAAQDESSASASAPVATATPVMAASVVAVAHTSPAAKSATTVPHTPRQAGERIKASPVAKRIAEDMGIDLADIQGSGPQGRIVKADVVNYQPHISYRGNTITRQADNVEKLSPMRKSIAARLTASKQTVPHFYLNADVRMDKVIDIRAQLNAKANGAYKLTINDFILKACALALHDNPETNAAWGGDRIVNFGNVDISVAVAIDGGLITPIVFNADQKNIFRISSDVKNLAGQAKAGMLTPEQYEGGSFSLSNLGMYGTASFNAIINPPQAAILAVGATAPQALVNPNTGAVEVGHVMGITLSVDHRVIDGAGGANLLASIKNNLENPALLLV